ncbi:hypothetical protein JCM30471_35440 [Desulfuromonas carbonis]
MKTRLSLLSILMIGTASQAFAAGAEDAGMGPMMIAFLAFLALYLVCQLVPGVVLFWSLIKGVFAPAGNGRNVVVAEKTTPLR